MTYNKFNQITQNLELHCIEKTKKNVFIIKLK